MDKYEYDSMVDAFSLSRINNNYGYSMEITDDILIHLSSDEEIVGIEVLDASKVFDIKPECLEHPESISAKITSKNDKRYIEINITTPNSTRKIMEPLLNYSFNQSPILQA